MPSTDFVDFRPPAVNAEWLNEVNDYVFDGSLTSPSGGKKDAMNVLIQSMGYDAFVDYAAGLAMGATTQTVLYQGVVYAPNLADLPFTTSGAFEAAKFYEVAIDPLYITAASLAAPTGAALTGSDDPETRLRLNTYAKLRASTAAAMVILVFGSGIAGYFQYDSTDTTSADDGGTIIVRTGDGRRYKRMGVRELVPDWFAAPGDTNDTEAFQRLAAVVNAAGGGSIKFTHGKTYTVGKQTFAGTTGLGYAYQMADILKIESCATYPVVIDLNGAKIKFAAGLKFGSFNPTTGASYSPSMPFLNQDYGADVGIAIELRDNVSACVKNGEIDGNSANMTLGGQWGDIGYQRMGYGIHAFGNGSFKCEDVYNHHHCTDGITVGWTGIAAGDAQQPCVLINVRNEYNSRQGLSWVGGIGLTAINCTFSHTGQGVFWSAPGAGLDIEAESAVIRGGMFINCEFANNKGAGVVADSADSADCTFDRCRFYGTESTSVYVSKPGMRFRKCLMSGLAYPGLGVMATESRRITYEDCDFTPTTFEGIAPYGTQLMDASGNPKFIRCHFSTTVATIRLGASSATAGFVDCDFTQNGSTATSTLKGVFTGRNSLTITTGSNDFGGSCTNYGELLITGTVAGIAAASGKAKSSSQAFEDLYSIGSNGVAYQVNHHTYGYAAPSSGTRERGDIHWNTQPSASGTVGWVCVTAGTPGTWKTFGAITA